MLEFMAYSRPIILGVDGQAGKIIESANAGIYVEPENAQDLATYLTGAVPVRVFAESIGGTKAPPITDDQCFITVRHANGSISNIAYWAGGDKAFPSRRSWKDCCN